MKKLILIAALVGVNCLSVSAQRIVKETFYGSIAVPNDINPCEGALKAVCCIRYYEIKEEPGVLPDAGADVKKVIIKTTTTDPNGKILNINEDCYYGDAETAEEMIHFNKAANSIIEN